MNIQIYTDGSARNNGYENAVGAWGYMIVNNGIKTPVIVGIEQGATNQQMEMEACIRGCKAVVDAFLLSADDNVEIITDSAYVYNCAAQKWYSKWEANGWVTSSRTPVLNKERWEQLIPYFKNPAFKFVKTKGHANDKYNCIVDNAVQAATLKEKNKCQEL